LLSQIQLLESRVMGIAEYGLIYILEMNPCMVGNTDWSDRYWHLLSQIQLLESRVMGIAEYAFEMSAAVAEKTALT
jgi:hypothetical protein